MAAQIQIQDTIIELGEEINYNFQVGDIAEISKSKSTYTSSFKIPRLSEFERLFNGLAIPGDRSKFPYQINDVYLLDDYVPIMKGVLVFMRTDELYFNVTAISGAFDFFTEIGDTKFSDIDISEIVHEKTLDVVADRIAGLIIQPYGGHYTYGFAQFGGMSHYTDGGGPVTVNIDALCPVVTARYLWDKIFEAFPRFTFSGDFYSTQDFERLWVVFPYGPFGDVGVPSLSLTTKKLEWGTFAGIGPITGYENWSDIDVVSPDFQVNSNWQIESLFDGVARVDVNQFNVIVGYGSSPGTPSWISLTVKKNGSEILYIRSQSTESQSILDSQLVEVSAGDTLDFVIERNPDFDGQFMIGEIVDLTMSFNRVSFDQSSSDKAFGLKIRDFIKEVMWRYGLLAFVDNNHIDFVRMGDIIESGDVVDWSDKYVRRTEEEYTLDYNQNNWLRHKYDDEDAEYFDRNIEVDNKNIAPEKTIIQSLFYAPSENESQYRVHPDRVISVRQFLIFDPSINTIDLEEDNAEFEYKTQQRYFFARVTSENIPYRIGSATMGGVVDSPATPGTTKLTHVITFADLAFADNPYYDALTKILNPTRAHRIELKLTAIDVNQLSLNRLYYFEQEQARYMLNKLQYKRGTVAKGEFIKISETIAETWVASGATCQLDGGYRTGWVEYSTLTNPLTGATKPNTPSDPDYVAPEYDPVACEPQATLIVSNEDTDRSDPYRLFVDADLVVFVNSVQVAYMLDVETRTIPVNVGDTIRVKQQSAPEYNPWPPNSAGILEIRSGGVIDTYFNDTQAEVLNDETFTIQPGVNRVDSRGVSFATGYRKYTFNVDIINPPGISEIPDLGFVILEGGVSVGVRGAWELVTEFNVIDDSGTIDIRAENTSPTESRTVTLIGASTQSFTLPPMSNHIFTGLTKSNYLAEIT